MAENLSQNQIDDLLKKMRGGQKVEAAEPEEPKTKVKEYDFSTPKKFTKDQLKSLTNLYETFCRVESSYFTGILRDICEVNVVQVEEQRYNEFNNSLPDSALVAMIDFRPGEKQYQEMTLMVDIATSFGYLIVERLMGSMGDAYVPDRDYTDIELAILHTVLTRLTDHLREAWSNYIAVSTELRSIETNGRMLQAYSPQDVVVITSLEITSGEFSGMANICMPAENLDSIIAGFGTRYSRMAKQQDPEREKVKKELVMDSLKQTELEVEAILDQFPMAFEVVLGLQVNDVIVSNKKIDSCIRVNVDGIPWYSAKLGETKTKKAVKLVDSITK
jgi:flagellar motor switch protein FliM